MNINATIDVIGHLPNPEQFLNVCEDFTVDLFNKKGSIGAYSVFLPPDNQLLLVQWSFDNVTEKEKAMNHARAMCKLLHVTKYFFASEVWITAIRQDDPELDSKMKKINQSGVRNAPDKEEKLSLIIENKGEKTIIISYDILRDKGKPRLGNRLIMDGVDKGRMVGILE